MTNRIKFTIERVSGISDRPAKGKRLYYYDLKEKGLGLSITPAGTKSFFYHGRINRRPERIPAGRFPEVSVEEAKSNIIKIRAAIEAGLNPRDVLHVARPRRSGIVTLGDFFEQYLDDYAKQHTDGWVTTQKDFKRYFKQLSRAPIDSITPDMVLSWHKRLGSSSGGPTANKQVNLLRALFSKAMLWRKPNGIAFASINPAAATIVPRFEENERSRFLRPEELPMFFHAIASCEVTDARHFILLALLTGARKSNVMAMAFDDIDRVNWIWTIPKAQVKGKRGQRHPLPLPLIKQAQGIIAARHEVHGGSWVFPGRRYNGNHITNVNTWIDLIRKSSGINDITLHDLRRTIASWMAMTGASYPIIAQFLGHSLPGTTKIYARLAIEPVRDAAQIAANKMWEVGGVE